MESRTCGTGMLATILQPLSPRGIGVLHGVGFGTARLRSQLDRRPQALNTGNSRRWSAKLKSLNVKMVRTHDTSSGRDCRMILKSAVQSEDLQLAPGFVFQYHPRLFHILQIDISVSCLVCVLVFFYCRGAFVFFCHS